MTEATTQTGRPFANSKVVAFIAEKIDSLAPYKKQHQIAAEIGYPKPNMLSMVKTGQSRVPLDKIPALAKALNVDASFMLRLEMLDYYPELYQMISQMLGTVLIANELDIIKHIRSVSGNGDPMLDHKRRRDLTLTFAP